MACQGGHPVAFQGVQGIYPGCKVLGDHGYPAPVLAPVERGDVRMAAAILTVQLHRRRRLHKAWRPPDLRLCTLAFGR